MLNMVLMLKKLPC